MSGSKVFFSFAEEAVKDRELNHQSLSSILGKPIQILQTFKKRFYRQQFSFVSLTFGLTEQFQVVCLFVGDRENVN